MQEEYYINQYSYKDKKTGLGLIVYSRTLEFAESLKTRFEIVDDMNFIRKRIGFCKQMIVSIPPYEVEKMQEEYIEEMERKYRDQQDK